MAIQLRAEEASRSIKEDIKSRVQKFSEKQKRSPKLAVILVGSDPASIIYTRRKGDAALAVGIEHETIALDAGSSPSQVKEIIDRMNQDPTIDGILLQRPLPKSFNETEVVYWIHPDKDVDAFHPLTVGRLYAGHSGLQPCTPAGIMVLLKHFQIDPSGRLACVIGRSAIVGRPMATLLLQAHATVIHCHSKTPRIRKLTRQADLLIVATGKQEWIDSSYIQTGAVVVDVGIHRNNQGKIVGDVLYHDVAPLASAITPVPGGVGPMTITMLLQNTVQAAEIRSRINLD